MNMLRHNDGGMKMEAIGVAPQTALQDCVTSLSGERLLIAFAESDKERPVRFLVMGKHPAIFVHSGERYAFGVQVLVWHVLL